MCFPQQLQHLLRAVLTTNRQDTHPMLKALLALLLLRADASSYGFSVAWNMDSSLVHHARGYAANVVNISMNDLTTMRITEVLCPSMDNLSTHTDDRALLTTPLPRRQDAHA